LRCAREGERCVTLSEFLWPWAPETWHDRPPEAHQGAGMAMARHLTSEAV
jgi:hypothetical protein